MHHLRLIYKDNHLETYLFDDIEEAKGFADASAANGLYEAYIPSPFNVGDCFRENIHVLWYSSYVDCLETA